MSEVIDDILSYLGDAISNLIDWFFTFFKDIFTGRSITSLGSSVINIFINGTFDFSLKSIFEILFGIAFLILAIKLIIHIIRG